MLLDLLSKLDSNQLSFTERLALTYLHIQLNCCPPSPGEMTDEEISTYLTLGWYTASLMKKESKADLLELPNDKQQISAVDPDQAIGRPQ